MYSPSKRWPRAWWWTVLLVQLLALVGMTDFTAYQATLLSNPTLAHAPAVVGILLGLLATVEVISELLHHLFRRPT